MFRNILMMSVATGFLTLAVPALADDQPKGEPAKCTFHDNEAGFDSGNRHIDQARTEFRQAGEWRELANGARQHAKTLSNPADRASREADAQYYENEAKKLEEKARQNLAAGKEELDRFKKACAGVSDALDGLIEAIIEGGDLSQQDYDNIPQEPPLTEAELNPEKEVQKAEAPVKPQKPAKPQKPKPQKPQKPNKKPKPQQAGNNNHGAEMAATLLTGIALGVIGNELMDGDGHHKPHKPHKPHPEVEDFEHGDHVKPIKIKKPKKAKKLKKVMPFF